MFAATVRRKIASLVYPVPAKAKFKTQALKVPSNENLQHDVAPAAAGASAVKAQAPKKHPAEIKLTALEKKTWAFANISIKRANLLILDGEYARAEEVLRAVDQVCDGETRHLNSLGTALAAQDRFEEAEVVFRRLIEIDPTVLAPVSRLADMLVGQGRELDAAIALEDYVKATKPDSNLKRRIQTLRNLAGHPSPAVAKIRDEATSLLEQAPTLTETQQRVFEELKQTGIAMTSYQELFGGNGQLWEEAEAEFKRFGDDGKVKELIARISGCKDFAEDPELSKLFKPSIVNYRKFFGDLTPDSPITKLYYSDEILGISNAYNGMASKIRNMHMWINPPLHPENVNGRKGSQLWHRDQEDSRILKCFIYFSDIDEGSGATDYVKNTGVDCTNLKDRVIPYPSTTGYPAEPLFYSRVPKEDFVRADGPKGTIVFLDTNGFHRGGFVKERARYIAMCTYLRPISPYVAMNTKIEASPEELAALSPLAAYGLA